MDMNRGNSSVVDLPLSNPACKNSDCIAFDAATNQSQLATPWAGQFEYGRWTTWYYLAILVVVVAWRAPYIRHGRARQLKNARATAPSLWQKGLAAGRYLSYRRFRGPWSDLLELPSVGMLALLLTSVLFLGLLTFAARPYYRAHEGYGSPPIAIRTGLMAFACTPILIALAGKANMVTLLTGISHEKLNVIHRWVGWMTLALSLIHTIPFIVAPLRDRGYTTLHQEFYGYGLTGATMYSGVPPLAMLFGLVTLSIPYIRHRIYKGFYYAHVLLAIAYLGLLFWHAANLLDSWAYLWATLALWLASYLARTFWYTRPLSLQSEWFTGAPTTLLQCPGGMTRIEVLAPTNFRHTSAQHCFLRFPSISLVDNHPFTIVSAPPPETITVDGGGHDTTGDVKSHSLVFLARTRDGFTRRLADYCSSHVDILASAWIDGPYGGVGRPIELLYDQLIAVAGGSGITACIPWLQHILNRSSTAATRSLRVKRVILHWIVRKEEHVVWVEKELRSISHAANRSNVTVDMKFYVTGGSIKPLSTTEEATEMVLAEKTADTINVKDSQSSSSEQAGYPGQFIPEKPAMAKLLLDVDSHQTSFVIGCGPESLRTDLSNACADAQARVLRGNVHEVGMHLEAFSW